MQKQTDDMKRIRFHIRVSNGSPIEEFGIIKNHVRYGYKLMDGEIYELPQSVIDFIHSFVIKEYYSFADGTEKYSEKPRYYCEPVHELLDSRES